MHDYVCIHLFRWGEFPFHRFFPISISSGPASNTTKPITTTTNGMFGHVCTYLSLLLLLGCLDMYACMFVWICLHMCVCVSDLLLSVSCAQACAFHIASRLVEMQQLPWGCRWGTTLGRPASLVLLLTKVVMLTALVSTKVRLSTEPEGLWNICRSNCRQIDIDQRITTALLVCMYLCMLLCMCACVAWHVCMCVFASVCACVRAYLHEYSVCTLTLTLQMYPLATTTAPPTTGCMHACMHAYMFVCPPTHICVCTHSYILCI